MADTVPAFDGMDERERRRLVEEATDAYARAAELAANAEKTDEDAPLLADTGGSVEIPQFPDLIGIDEAVYRQINAALKAGKQHLMLYGPPGTGKTTLAQRLAGALNEKWCMITGSADWTSQDVIGGYQPIGEGAIQFIPGILLQNFDRPIIIDELNRCDIDKVIGPLFTVLSDQPTSLPYRIDVKDPHSAAYVILPKPKPGTAPHEFAPKKEWRIIATINTIDKSALYQISFALSRRFGWIYVDAPPDIRGFLLEFWRKTSIIDEQAEPAGPVPLEMIWSRVNSVRVIGPAPIIDMVRTIRAIDSSVDFLSVPTSDQANMYLDAFYMFILPILDGIPNDGAKTIGEGVSEALALKADALEKRLLFRRLESITV
jgi:5-methylcytosine-specific restriction enzyme B